MLAGFLGFASFFLISLFYRHVRKMDGMGMGDAKLFAGIGLWSGVFYLAPIALLGSLVALVVVLVLHVVGKPVGRGRKIPFGFFLGFGFLIVFYATRFSVVAY